ncbi:MAG: histidine kinase [Bacteroidales bacterium]|nr:histidine kinase [Bacteroidales bacterium]
MAQLPVFGYEKLSTEVERLEKGISQNSVRCILQDQNGFMWFGTWSGLNRYDGQNIISLFNELESYGPTLSSSVINALEQGSDGNIWVGTEVGLNRLNPKNLKVTNFLNYQTKYPQLSDTIFSLKSDKSKLWIGTQKGLYSLDLHTDSVKLRTVRLPAAIKSAQIRSIDFLNDKQLIVATDFGLWIVEKNTYQVSRVFKQPFLSSSLILSLLKFDEGIWFVGTENGLNIIDLTLPRRISYQVIGLELSLQSSIVTSMMRDKDSNIWVGTSGNSFLVINDFKDSILFAQTVSALPIHSDKVSGKLIDEDYYYSILQSNDGTIWLGSAYSGVFKLVNETNIFKKFQKSGNSNGLNDNHIWSFLENGDDFWIGTEKGVNIYNPQSHKVTVIDSKGKPNYRLSSDQVRSLYKDSRGYIWIGTYKSGLNRLNTKTGEIDIFSPDSSAARFIADKTVWKVLEDKRNNHWFATHNGLQRTNFLTGKTKVFRNIPGDTASLSSNVVYNIYFDRSGNLWVSTFDGLNLYLPDKDKFKVFKRKLGQSKSLNTNRIFCVYQDTALNYWIGTIGGGLNHLDPITGEVTHFTTNNGLSDNTVYNILDDGRGNLWLSTNYGISAFNISNKSFVNYTANDGLTSNEFNFGAALKDRFGNMYFGGMFGFNVLMPGEFKVNNLEPEIRISEFKINDNIEAYVLNNNDLIELSHNQNNLEFRLTILDYINPAKTIYKYRISGFYNEWRTLSAHYPVITLSKLPPGKYEFEIIAMNSYGIWTLTSFKLTLSKNKAWYNLFIVRFSLALLLLGFLSLILWRRINIIRKKHQTERQLLELEKQALRLQMNPHFIFNTLNSIQNFILKNDTDQSINYLSKFSKLMRMMLNYSRETFISIDDEITLIKAYLELERLRLEKSFSWFIHIDPKIETDFYGIPPMIIQPFVENAIIHGLLPLKSREGILELHLELDKSYLKVRISDNGVGRKFGASQSENHKPSGILITRKRLELINKMPGESTSYQVTDLKDKMGNAIGTIVEIRIKVEELEN